MKVDVRWWIRIKWLLFIRHEKKLHFFLLIRLLNEYFFFTFPPSFAGSGFFEYFSWNNSTKIIHSYWFADEVLFAFSIRRVQIKMLPILVEVQMTTKHQNWKITTTTTIRYIRNKALWALWNWIKIHWKPTTYKNNNYLTTFKWTKFIKKYWEINFFEREKKNYFDSSRCTFNVVHE